MRLDNNCPCDFNNMHKVNGKSFCSSCQKHVQDLTGKSDIATLSELSKLKTQSACIRIEKSKFERISGNISNWKLFLVVALNIKSFFIQKLSAQNFNPTTPSSPTNKTITRTINGTVVNNKTGFAVKNAIIEVYRNDSLIKRAKGDWQGRFSLKIKSESSWTDVVSLKIYSDSYVGATIPNIPLNKRICEIEARIPKKGESKELKPMNEMKWNESTLMGNVRFLD